MSISICPNLLQLVGDRYRVSFDPAYDPFRVPRDKLDPWMMVLRGHRGEIYPFGDDKLAVFATPAVAAHLRAIPGLTLWTDGSDGRTFVFPVSALDAVAQVIRPRKRRRLSEEARRQACERLARYHGQASPSLKGGINALETHGTVSGEPEPTPGLPDVFTVPAVSATAAVEERRTR
jgi:hypothetical protein